MYYAHIVCTKVPLVVSDITRPSQKKKTRLGGASSHGGRNLSGGACSWVPVGPPRYVAGWENPSINR